jgi:hypothetical protein
MFTTLELVTEVLVKEVTNNQLLKELHVVQLKVLEVIEQ